MAHIPIDTVWDEPQRENGSLRVLELGGLVSVLRPWLTLQVPGRREEGLFLQNML
jgi:hypothetical protein